MAYPNYRQTNESRMTVLDDIQTDRSSNGGLRGRSFYTTIKRRFEVVHPIMEATDSDALMAYYLANRTLSFDFTWHKDGVTRTCWFGAAPKFDVVAGGYLKPTVYIEEQ